MIIRSADGESIVNFENLSLLQMEKHEDTKAEEDQKKITYKIVAYDTGSSTATVLAEYSTREQALKVLDEIQDNYSTKELYTVDMGDGTVQQDFCKYYQLPKDEVEE